jgi:hypothetical protein
MKEPLLHDSERMPLRLDYETLDIATQLHLGRRQGEWGWNYKMVAKENAR